MSELQNENLNMYFSESYDKYSDAIFRYCLYQTSNREKALDLTQDTFIKTWEYLSNNNSKKIENLRAFLYKVAINLIIDYRRKKKADSLDQMTEAGFDVRSEIDEASVQENAFDGKIALKALKNLDEKYKDVLTLRFVEDMDIKEIAKILEESENNISVRIHRGLEKLKNVLKEN